MNQGLDSLSNSGRWSPYLRLDAVEASTPQHVAAPQLHLSVVDGVHVLHLLQLLLRDLLLLRAVTRCLQELEPVGGDAGHQLEDTTTQSDTRTTATLPVPVLSK